MVCGAFCATQHALFAVDVGLVCCGLYYSDLYLSQHTLVGLACLPASWPPAIPCTFYHLYIAFPSLAHTFYTHHTASLPAFPLPTLPPKHAMPFTLYVVYFTTYFTLHLPLPSQFTAIIPSGSIALPSTSPLPHCLVHACLLVPGFVGFTPSTAVFARTWLHAAYILPYPYALPSFALYPTVPYITNFMPTALVFLYPHNIVYLPPFGPTLLPHTHWLYLLPPYLYYRLFIPPIPHILYTYTPAIPLPFPLVVPFGCWMDRCLAYTHPFSYLPCLYPLPTFYLLTHHPLYTPLWTVGWLVGVLHTAPLYLCPCLIPFTAFVPTYTSFSLPCPLPYCSPCLGWFLQQPHGQPSPLWTVGYLPACLPLPFLPGWTFGILHHTFSLPCPCIPCHTLQRHIFTYYYLPPLPHLPSAPTHTHILTHIHTPMQLTCPLPPRGFTPHAHTYTTRHHAHTTPCLAHTRLSLPHTHTTATLFCLAACHYTHAYTHHTLFVSFYLPSATWIFNTACILLPFHIFTFLVHTPFHTGPLTVFYLYILFLLFSFFIGSFVHYLVYITTTLIPTVCH